MPTAEPRKTRGAAKNDKLSSKIRRWLHILELLPETGNGYTADDIVQKLAQSEFGELRHKRTILRDMKEMQEGGIAEFHEDKDDNGATTWRITPRVGRTRMSPIVATTVKLSVDHMRGLLPPDAYESLTRLEESADKVLRAGRGAGIRPWREKIRVIPEGHLFLPPVVDDTVYKTIYAAVAADQKIRITYESPNGRRSTGDYSPLAILVRPPKFQLLVYRGNGEPRVFNFHRIHAAEALNARVWLPDHWSLDAWLNAGHQNIRFGDAGRIRVRAQRDLVLNKWLVSPLGENQTHVLEAETDQYLVEFDAVETWALRAQLLSHGDQVEVLSPPSLREWISGQARNTASRYGV